MGLYCDEQNRETVLSTRHVCQNTENIDMSVLIFGIFGILNIDVGIGIFKYRDIGIGIPTNDQMFSNVPLPLLDPSSANQEIFLTLRNVFYFGFFFVTTEFENTVEQLYSNGN